jgi:Ca2+-dependent lipid-binding protein
MKGSSPRATESGIIIFNVVGGQLRKKARLEVLLDDAYWPAFSTVRARSTHVQWEYIGEGFIKELDFGRVWLRLNEADEGDKDEIIAEYKGDAKDFLKQTLVSSRFSSLLMVLNPSQVRPWRIYVNGCR